MRHEPAAGHGWVNALAEHRQRHDRSSAAIYSHEGHRLTACPFTGCSIRADVPCRKGSGHRLDGIGCRRSIGFRDRWNVRLLLDYGIDGLLGQRTRPSSVEAPRYGARLCWPASALDLPAVVGLPVKGRAVTVDDSSVDFTARQADGSSVLAKLPSSAPPNRGSLADSRAAGDALRIRRALGHAERPCDPLGKDGVDRRGRVRARPRPELRVATRWVVAQMQDSGAPDDDAAAGNAGRRRRRQRHRLEVRRCR